MMHLIIRKVWCSSLHFTARMIDYDGIWIKSRYMKCVHSYDVSERFTWTGVRRVRKRIRKSAFPLILSSFWSNQESHFHSLFLSISPTHTIKTIINPNLMKRGRKKEWGRRTWPDGYWDTLLSVVLYNALLLTEQKKRRERLGCEREPTASSAAAVHESDNDRPITLRFHVARVSGLKENVTLPASKLFRFCCHSCKNSGWLK